MGFLMGGAGSVDVRDLIDLAIQGKVQLLMSVVNWGEVYYSTWRYRGYDVAIRVADEISRLPIEIEDANIEATRMAAEMKARYRLAIRRLFRGEPSTEKGRDRGDIRRRLQIGWRCRGREVRLAAKPLRQGFPASRRSRPSSSREE